MKFHITFKSATRPLVLEAEDMYCKGHFTCFQMASGLIRRWPTMNIWEVNSDHKAHRGTTRQEHPMKTNVEEMIDERATGIVATAFERVHAFVEQFPAVAMSDVLFDVAAKLRKPKLYKPPTMALLNIALAQYGERREDVTRFIMLDSDFTILTLCQRDSQTGRSVPGGVVYKDVVQAFGRQVLATNPLPASEDYGQVIWRGDAVAAGKASFALRKPTTRKAVTFTQITDEPELPKAGQWYLDDCGELTQAQHDFTSLKYLIFSRTETPVGKEV